MSNGYKPPKSPLAEAVDSVCLAAVFISVMYMFYSCYREDAKQSQDRWIMQQQEKQKVATNAPARLESDK